jgi:hypothetical protein
MRTTKNKNTATFLDLIATFGQLDALDPQCIEYVGEEAAGNKAAWDQLLTTHGSAGVMDPANVAMLSTNSPRVAALIAATCPHMTPQKEPKFNSTTAGPAKYSLEYLKHIFKALGSIETAHGVTIEQQKDYPLRVTWTLNNQKEYIRYILAPRVDNDE